ncbi:MAG: NAD-dependent epimerase/dehydratase family protein [Acidobacteriota bacterium]
MESKRVLITGGAGFIGSHIVDAYLSLGHQVWVADNLSTGLRANLSPAARLHVGDFAESAALELIEREKIQIVNHQAAQIDVRLSVDDPAGDAEQNIVRTLRLLQRSQFAAVEKVIFASSGGAIYGDPQSYPQSEDHPCQPLSPYGCAKLAVEHYLHYFESAYGLKSVRLRYANVYGPRQSNRGEAGVVAIFATRALRGETLYINGSGQQTRDYVFIDDVVRANVAALEEGMEGPFNVGTGVETSVSAIASALEGLAGKPLQIVYRQPKIGEQTRSVLDAAKIRERAGLPPPVDFAAGLRRTWQWFVETQ